MTRKNTVLFTPTDIDITATLRKKGFGSRYINDHQDKYKYYLHAITLQSVFFSDDEYSYLSSEVLDELMYNKRKEIQDNLIEWGYIESDNYFITGEKCMGYRIAPAHQSKVRGEMVLNETFEANLQRKQAQAKKITAKGILSKNLKMIRIDYKAAGAYIDTKLSNSQRLLNALVKEHGNTTELYSLYNEYLQSASKRGCFYKLIKENKFKKALRKGRVRNVYQYLTANVTSKFNRDHLAIVTIKNKDFRAKRSETNHRLDTNLTNLSKDLRGFLYTSKYDDETLVNVDIRNSQPFLMSILLMKHYRHKELPTDVKLYILLTSTGRLYEFMMEQFNIPQDERDAFKIRLFASVFYCTIHYSKRTREGRMFRVLFPNVVSLIEAKKSQTDEKDAFKELSIEMQQAEAKIILDVISKRIAKEGIYLNTIHDSVVCFQRDAERVKEIMVDAFQTEYQLTPTLSVDVLTPLVAERVDIKISKNKSTSI